MIHNVYYICFSVGKCMSLATQECPSKKVQRRGSGSISPLRRRTTDRLTTLDEELGFNSLPEVVVLFLTNCVNLGPLVGEDESNLGLYWQICLLSLFQGL